MKLKKSFYYATATEVGFVVGAGIFGLPYVVYNLGFFPAILLLIFLILGTVFNYFSLLEIIGRTPGNNYFCNLAKIYLGNLGKWIELIIIGFSSMGAILAYFVLSGSFLNNLFGLDLPYSKFLFLLLFLMVGSIFIWKDLKELGFAEIIMFLGLVLTIALIAVSGFPHLEMKNFIGFQPGNAFSAFGVMLFALDGLSGIFIIKEILNRNKRQISKSIIVSYVFVAIIYIIFIATIVGIMGENTHSEAIVGIREVLGVGVEKAAIIFGILAVFSSYLVLGSSLKQTFIKDFNLGHFPAWVLVWSLPLLFYLLGFNNFIDVISLVGVIFVSLNSLIILILLIKSRKYGKRKPEFRFKLPIWINYLIVGVYFVAMIIEIYSFFN